MVVNFITFGIIIDDLVFHDGSIEQGVLGGGGPQTAFGMALWAEPDGSVGIISGVGHDFPPDKITWFTQSGINMEGIRVTDAPTPRAWQYLEENGRRNQVWQTPFYRIKDQLGRNIHHVPDTFLNIHGAHTGIHPEEIDMGFLHDLHRVADIVSVEPFKPADKAPSTDVLHDLFTSIEVFSPNLHEAISMIGSDQPITIVKKLLDLGVQAISLRLGPDGSIVAQKGSKKGYHIPAVPVNVVDPIGAGNAYCGGFLVGYSKTGDLGNSGCYGSVAASFLLEQPGIPEINGGIRMLATERLARINKRIEIIDL